MFVTLFSDLHLEFDKEDKRFHPGEGDVLILAGDICTAADINKLNPHGRIYRAFFDECVKNYNKVFYVMGNHEHYGYNFTYTAEKLRQNLPESVTLLDKQSVKYNGWNFMGASLWTNFAGGNPLAMQLAQTSMNDYKTIRYGSQYRKLLPTDILREFSQTLYWMEGALLEAEGPVFMITHHQPSYQSLDTSYRGSPLNPCYASELSNLIIAHPQIKFWAAGHTHVSLDYPIEQCRVLANTRGYEGYDLNPDFNRAFKVELT
ncbi:Metallophosphoesterase [Synechococcus phage S-CRM01]|uniref:metallo-phosphoesterase n=1 Tax=Synechococcus phage S-CRM01 TaxID=1026955 RepID=UPI000209E42D|nr:metallo-phosphoesterase [Synechococcus phage S-CRM01]AEC53166.1 Metallophosphoesterase [Synechococcus phage S-CRM01]